MRTASTPAIQSLTPESVSPSDDRTREGRSLTVELTKVVEEGPRQRAWYTITALPDGWTHVEVVTQREDRGQDVRSALFLCESDAEAHVYRACVSHFGRFSDAERNGATMSWEFAACQNTPQQCLDLAASIAEAVSDRLAEEAGVPDDLRATFEPIHWCEHTTQIWERGA